VFLADLVRELQVPVEVDFVRARSYGAGTSSRGAVEITKDLETDVRGRDVIVVEDIADSGLTLRVVVERIGAGEPASLRRCALLVREGCPPEDEPDFAGLRLGSGFVVGYGIDYAERYRGLRDIRALPPAEGGMTRSCGLVVRERAWRTFLLDQNEKVPARQRRQERHADVECSDRGGRGHGATRWTGWDCPRRSPADVGRSAGS